MQPLRRLMPPLHVVLAFSLCLQLVLPALTPAVAQAAATKPPRARAVGVAPEATAPSEEARLQALLDMVVLRSVTFAGWKVTALSSQLEATSMQSAATRQAGSGQWHVEVRDDKQAALTLDGKLTFDLAAASATNAPTTITTQVTGTLKGADTELAIQTVQAGHTASGGPSANATYALSIRRQGSVHQVTASQNIDSSAIAAGLNRSTNGMSIERDGVKSERRQTLTARVFGQGESEVWLDSVYSVSGAQNGSATSSQHFAQHWDGNAVAQYWDRYDLNLGKDAYTLQSPVSVSGASGGHAQYDFTLATAQGKTIHVASNATQSFGSDTRSPGLSAPLPSMEAVDSAPDLLPQNGGMPAPPQGACSDVVNTVGGLALGIAFALLLGEALIPILGEVVVEELIMGELLEGVVNNIFVYMQNHTTDAGDKETIAELSLLVQAALGGLTGDAIIGRIVGAISNVVETGLGGLAENYLCNADPYFVYPDIRVGERAPGTDAVQITRVTSGLLAASRAVSATVPLSGPVADAGQSDVTYREAANAFVGGALPASANSIGPWTWDDSHSFRGAPAHTQPRTTGSQAHYFIHAAQPLSVGAGDNLIQYVYLDAQNPPGEIYLQFYTGDGDGEHRAYWGDDKAQTGGKAGMASLYPMGALPAKGGWVRLQVSADKLGLAGKPIDGILFGAFDGQTWWGPTTTSNHLTDNAPDKFPVVETPLPASQPGAQIAVRVAQPMPLSIEIVDANGTLVRSLAKDKAEPAGYQVVSWDATNDVGAPVADTAYRVRFSVSGKVVAEASVSISPFVAHISSPAAFSLVRGIDVPIYGDAFGTKFKNYIVEYGEGLAPHEWKTIVESNSASVMPAALTASHVNSGNLANWNTGIDEYAPYTDKGLSGIYTLRLRVLGQDGREASDTFPVIVGRLAPAATGGVITSGDGKARLSIPALATENAFALMALLPADKNISLGIAYALPTDKTLAGPLYEIFPADELFRRPATLELPYDATNRTGQLGILLGDGTANGWRYLGGTVDDVKHLLSVSVGNFGGKRALVGVFNAAQFDRSPIGGNGAPLVFDTQGAAPVVTSSSAPSAFYNDLQALPGDWQALDVAGTQLTRVKGTEAGLVADNAALQVTHTDGGARLVRVRATPYDASNFPLLSFDYRIGSGHAPNILVRSNGTWWQFQTNQDSVANQAFGGDYYATLQGPPMLVDNAWHHYQLDLLSLLRANLPQAKGFQVDEIALGQLQGLAYLQYVPADDDPIGSTYYIDNFTAQSATNAAKLSFSWAPPAGTTFNAYSTAFDQKSDTIPAESAQLATTTLSASLPSGGSDGLWYFHVRGRDSGGAWSATAHFPVLVDRQPPTLGNPDPAVGGAGSPDFMVVPLSDTGSGIDLAALRVQLQGQEYAIGDGLTYDPQAQSLELTPGLLKPTPAFIANGQRVDLSLTGIADYAGNKLTAAAAWSFTADRPMVQGDDFRQLTTNGGESPFVSPDGAQVAFVSTRSGVQKVYLMRADDFGEKGGSVKALDNDSARESDPAWSPDGKHLAWVSESSAGPQLHVGSADGSGAQLLAVGGASLASPIWSPDGKTLIFIRDGNLAQVNADGNGIRTLTEYPEHPLKAVRWQPGGQLLALDFKLYQETIDLYNLVTGELQSLTHGGRESSPAWLNANTMLYSAPAAQGQPDAIWQIDRDGSGAAIVTGSGQAGSGDAQTSVSDEGNTFAMVSTRGGGRNIWIRSNLQLAQFDVLPTIGAARGDTFNINYALPADAQVTLRALKGNDVVKVLLDKAKQRQGPQSLTWDGTGADGKALAAGNYIIKLSAQFSGSGEPLERYADARVLDPAGIGSLRIQVNQWAGAALTEGRNVSVQVFPHGLRSRPAGESNGDANPTFKLPAGQYDVVTTFGDVRFAVNGAVVEGGRTTAQNVDLQLGALKVTLLSAPNQPVSGAAFVTVSRSDDRLHAPVAIDEHGVSSFVLAPGHYDVSAEVQGVRQSLSAVEVRAAQTTTQTIDFGAGTLVLNVRAFEGKPAQADARLSVQAYSRQDHAHALATSLDNPARLLLPAGSYDIHVQYGVAALSPNLSGNSEQWLNGVQINAGETLERDYALSLGEVELSVDETAGHPADEHKLTVDLYHAGDRSSSVAEMLNLNKATLQLTPGVYDVVVDYRGTNLSRLEPVASITVPAGQHSVQAVDLKLAYLRVEVAGLTDSNGLKVHVYPAGRRDQSFSDNFDQNPAELPLRAGTTYDVIIELNNKTVGLNGQSAREGDTIVLKVNFSDFR